MQAPLEYRLDIGDVQLSVLEWAGDGDPILLLHATGFHSRCWNEVVRRLPGRHIYAADLRFHGGSDDSGAVDWRVMARDIQLLIEKLEFNRLVGVGHSIGGHLIARAAAHAPQRFKHLVLVDPVIMSPERYASFQQLAAGLEARHHPVSRRKNAWRNANEMFERFRERAPFNSWQPAVLRDYCEYALRPADQDTLRQLACDPLKEAGISTSRAMRSSWRNCRIQTPVTLLRAAGREDAAPNPQRLPPGPGWPPPLPTCEEIYLPHMNHLHSHAGPGTGGPPYRSRALTGVNPADFCVFCADND
ncbi:MAG: alpha/beta hydrolase [Halioglobus sp.]